MTEDQMHMTQNHTHDVWSHVAATSGSVPVRFAPLSPSSAGMPLTTAASLMTSNRTRLTFECLSERTTQVISMSAGDQPKASERHLPGGWSGGFQPPPHARAAGMPPVQPAGSQR